MYRLLALLPLLLLAGCYLAVGGRVESSGGGVVPVGSTVELREPLPLGEGRARLFLQLGRVVAVSGMDQYTPSCNFEVRTLSDGSAAIRPGRFTVTAVEPGWEEVVLQEGLRFAAAALVADDTMPVIFRHYHLYLDAPGQPDLLRLTCRGTFDDADKARYPTVAEIRAALGTVAELRLPAEAGTPRP